MKRFLLVIAVLIAQAIPTTAESREKDLDRWVDRDLIPHVRKQLLVHPRFKGETVMFVVLRDNAPTPVSNELAISLRDRLLDAAINTPGVSVGWQQGRQATTPGGSSIDCTRDDVHYYIGLEITQELDTSYTVNVRALDLEDRSWVTGFGRKWQGQLRTIHRQAMRQSRVDKTFQGSRDVPFTLAETDLLARQLAHSLSCSLLRESTGRYIVDAAKPDGSSNELDATLELVGNNLALSEAIELAGDSTSGNAVLRAKAHRIDGPLAQYWLTVTPADPDSELTTLGASAYVLLPEPMLASAEPPPLPNREPRMEPSIRPHASVRSISIPNAAADPFIGPLTIRAPGQLADCGDRRQSYMRGGTACSLLEAESQRDAIVFFLAYQANHGLVRLGGRECRERTVARIASSGKRMRFPIPRVVTEDRSSETYDWLVEPEVDTYYAVAMTDARAARGVANHIDSLPLKCGEAIRPGLEGAALKSWLDDFAMLAARSANSFDWRALEVRDIL